MKKRIIFSDGGKGGVGKSMTSTAIVDYLLSKGRRPVVVDSDPTNPDVARLFKSHESVMMCVYDFRKTDDWMVFLESLESIPDDVEDIVINLPAAIDLRDHLVTAFGVFESLGFETTGFFTMNRHSDSLNLLGESMRNNLLSYTENRVVVLNGLFGDEKSFQRWHESETKKKFLSVGGQAIYLPELYYRSCDICLLEQQKTFSESVKKEMPIVYKTQINQWLKTIHTKLDKLFENISTPNAAAIIN